MQTRRSFFSVLAAIPMAVIAACRSPKATAPAYSHGETIYDLVDDQMRRARDSFAYGLSIERRRRFSADLRDLFYETLDEATS
jgi:hypothetical protein